MLCMLVAFVPLAQAQRERNYIYILDCTKSMSGFRGTPDIWNQTKEYLRADIKRLQKGTTVHIIPFQAEVLPVISFDAQDFNWSSIEATLDGYLQNITNTNICDAWTMAQRYVDSRKDNYIYLYTDGADNVKGIPKLRDRLDNFCGKITSTQAFYVMLTPSAVSPEIKRIADNCPNITVVDAGVPQNPFGRFADAVVYANTLNLDKTHKLSFSAAGEFKAKVVCNDPNFSVDIDGDEIEDGLAKVKITAKKPEEQLNDELPDTYDFTFSVRAEGVYILNPKIKVKVTNKPVRDLTLPDTEQYIGTAEWYDAFLFCGARKPQRLKVDLGAQFNSEAIADKSSITLRIADADKHKDCTFYFNGQKVSKGAVTLKASEQAQAVFEVEYTPQAKQGKRYIDISVKQTDKLECVNMQQAKQYKVTLRAEYDVVWNPLKVILLWLGILIVAALVLWFLILKPMLYPTISVGSIMISDPYFSNVRVKGARRVIFANKMQRQSALNRLFTGKVICNVNPCWTKPLVMEPSKKRIRVQRNSAYVFDPFGAILSPRTDYVVLNNETNQKIQLKVN